MKVFHIVCMVLMIVMMQHTCFADEQTEIIYGDGWTHYNYIDGTQAHKLAPTNYLRWDGEWRPISEMNLLSGDWPYLVEEFDTYYFISRFDDSLTLSKTYRIYDFQPYKIRVHLTLTPTQLNQISTYHNVGGTDYWYIIIPRSLKETASHLNWDNKLPTISNETGIILNQSDNASGEWISNYKYQNVGSELRLYYGQVARDFGIASTEVTFDFNSYIINSSTNWENTSYNLTREQQATGYNILEWIPSDALGHFTFDEGSGSTAYDENITNVNDGTLGSNVTWVSGIYGNAVEFNKTADSKITITDNSLYDFNNQSFSIVMYIKPSDDLDDTGDTILVGKKGATYHNNGWYVYTEQYGSAIVLDMANGVTYEAVNSNDLTWEANTGYWIAVVFNYSEKTGYFYRDKVSIGSDIYSLSGATAEPNLVDVSIGIGPTISQPFNGTFDHIIFFGRVLTNDEINQTIDNCHQSTGNVTHWHDVSSGYQSSQFKFVFNNDSNSFLEGWVSADNSTWYQVTDNVTNNTFMDIPAAYKNQTQYIRAFLKGNGTSTPEEIEAWILSESVGAAPNITSWQNNKTLNDTLDFIINISEEVKFNATSNQTITAWNWYNDNIDQSHNYDNITLNWSIAGLKHVVINATNTNGISSSITWNVTVLDTEPELTPTPTPAPVISVTSAQYDELDLPLILYILTISMLYLFIAFRHGVAAVELSLIYLIFAFFFLLFQTITISVNYIYLTLFLLVFLISIAGITKQGVD